MRRAPDRELEEIVEGQSSPSRVEPSHRKLTAQHRGDLEIDQLGRSDVLTTQAPPRGVTVRTVVAQGGRENARVNDEHGLFGRPWPQLSG